MKTNFEVITQNPYKLAEFLSEFEKSISDKGSPCMYCSQYVELQEPVCHIDCKLGIKLWLESGSDE